MDGAYSTMRCTARVPRWPRPGIAVVATAAAEANEANEANEAGEAVEAASDGTGVRGSATLQRPVPRRAV